MEQALSEVCKDIRSVLCSKENESEIFKIPLPPVRGNFDPLV
jgi:hypothetical protein